jgi:hypothetical protein
MLQNINGIPVIIDLYCTTSTQYKFPHTRKKRIQKKWSKQKSNFKNVPGAYLIRGRLVCHPSIYDNLKKQLDIDEHKRTGLNKNLVDNFSKNWSLAFNSIEYSGVVKCSSA